MPRSHTAMNFISTRGNTPPTSIDTALVAGLAPDGGLYVPERIPRIALARPLPTLPQPAHAGPAPYFAPSPLRGRPAALFSQALSFDAPLRRLRGRAGSHLRPFYSPP